MSFNEIQPEDHLVHFKNGLKIAKHFDKQSSWNIHHLLQKPFNIYFINGQSTILKINDYCAETMGWISSNTAKNKNVKSVLKQPSADCIIAHDEKVIAHKRSFLAEEEVYRKDEILYQRLSLKVPLYDSNSELTGIFGCSIILGKQSLIEGLNFISSLKLPVSSLDLKINEYINPFNFTHKQKLILRFLILGKTASTISEILHLSRRTVEWYITDMKNKMNVSSKEQLIEHGIQVFYPDIFNVLK